MKNKANLLSRQEIKRIAVSYATSPDDVSASYYVETYHITESVFYHCLEKAVMESIVDMETVYMISAKAGRNGARHAGEGARVNSTKHYQRFIDARELFRFGASDRKKFVKKYADSELSFQAFCAEECVAEFIMTHALKTAIIKEEIDCETVEKLYQKSEKFHGKENADILYDKLKAARSAHRDARLQNERAMRKARKERKQAEALERREQEQQQEQQQGYVQLTFADFGIMEESPD